jgi:hypothetical protein
MNAYVALTDRDWFESIAAQPGVDEVNFWREWERALRSSPA